MTNENKIRLKMQQIKESLANNVWFELNFVVEQVKELGEEAVPDLLEFIPSSEERGYIYQAISILYKTPQILEFFLGLLKSPDEFDKQFAANALAELGDKVAIPPLLQALNDESYVTRQAAVWAIGKFVERGHTEALEPLIKMLNDPNASVRMSTVFGLPKLGNNIVLEALLQALKKEEDEEVRREIVGALGVFEEDNTLNIVIDTLIGALQDKSSGIRGEAIFTLQRFPNERATQAIIPFLEDENKYVRFQAANYLLWTKDKNVIPLLQKALTTETEKDNRDRLSDAIRLFETGAIFESDEED